MIDKTPKRRKRDERARQAQERRWAARSGPVTSRVDPALREAHAARKRAPGV